MKSPLLQLSIFIILIPPSAGQAPAPDLSFVFSRKALDFILEETEKVLNKQLANLKLHNASQQIDGGSVEVHNVVLARFVPPTYFYSLESPHTLTWGLNDASMLVNGQWSGVKKLVLPYVKGSGNFELTIEQLSLVLRAQFGRNGSSGSANIDGFQCNATIANLTVRTTGGVMGYVLDVFRSTVAAEVKPVLEETLCDKMEHLIDDDLDKNLMQKLPVEYEVARKYSLKMTLTDAPLVDSKTGSVQLDHQVSVLYEGKDDTGKYLASGNRTNAGPPTPLTAPLDRMVYIRMSERPANMLLYTMHVDNMTAFIIDDHTSQEAANFLRLNCPSKENCLGNSLPGVSTVYPSGNGAIRAYTSREPQIHFNNGYADLKFPGVLEITARAGPPKYAEDNLLIADIDLEAIVRFSMDKEGKKLSGTWNVTKFDMVARPGGVTSLVKVDNKKLADSLKGFVVDQGSEKLTKGIDIPVASKLAPWYTLKDVTLKVLPKVMQFEADMSVQPAFKS